jgi:serine/threonine-protein kinase
MISDRAGEVFAEARELPPEARADYLRLTCASNDALRGEVERLLTAANDAERYFAGLAGRVGLRALADDSWMPLPRDTMIGAWRLLERIGHGGMGTVYLAERADGQFDQRGALKILPVGLDSEHARARFLVERQILARLSHANIARLLDGGVTKDGLPFFVMDYVEGRLIDDYCSAHELTIGDRLAKVLEVADAVQYAHRNLVIHRDLKPGNVIVDEQGRVRLLDFGIAKFQLPDSLDDGLTREALRPATPAFASPEMLRGEAVDVTTDVYSIGALLYVLLTGKQPLDFEGCTLAEVYRRSMMVDPVPLGRLDARLGGDLEAIVAKALAKQPQERYDSVEGLVSDIRNFLAGRPVIAKPPTMPELAIKFARRHRFGVAAAVAGLSSLAIITGLAAYAAVEADRQARQIALERDRAEQTKEFLVSIFTSADPEISPGTLTAREILERGRERIEEELAQQPEIQADLLRAMGSVYQSWRLAEEGRSVLERELALREKVHGVDSVAYAQTLISLAFTNETGGDYDASIEQARQALRIGEELGDEKVQAEAAERIGRILHLRGDLAGAETFYLSAMEGVLRHFEADALEVADITVQLANLYVHQQQYDRALEAFERSLTIRREHERGDTSAISSIYLGMGSALNSLGRLDEATAAYEAGLAINERLFGPSNSYEYYFVAGIGRVAEQRGDLDDALGHHLESRRLILLHMPESPNLAFADANAARVYARQGRFREAIPLFESAMSSFQEKLPDHWALGSVQWRLGQCLVETGRREEGERMIRAGLAIVEKHWGPEHEHTAEARAALRAAREGRQA